MAATTCSLHRRAGPAGPASPRGPASRARRLPCRPAVSRRLAGARVLAFRGEEEKERPPAANETGRARGDLGSSTSNGIGWGPVPLPDPDEAQAEMWREESVRDAQRRSAELADRVRAWWAELPDKRSFVLGGLGLLAVTYLSGAVLAAVDRTPLLPRAFQAVGLAYSSWFWWRYVLFAEGRRELRARAKGLRSRAAQTLDGLGDRTRDLQQPPPGQDPSSARGVVERLAARHTQAQQATARVLSDEGGGAGAAEARGADGGPALEEGYVQGLLQELEDESRDTASACATRDLEVRGDDGGAGAGGRAPTLFAFSVWAPEPGAEGASSAGAGAGRPRAAKPPQPPAPRAAAAPFPVAGPPAPGSSADDLASPHLDPCLGWDTEACDASGRMRGPGPDEERLARLADEAARLAQAALGFSRHVDQSLHDPLRPGASAPEYAALEGQFGRAAGTLEREEMEKLAATHSRKAVTPNSARMPSVAEEAGTGP